jgi:hypothetical protein
MTINLYRGLSCKDRDGNTWMVANRRTVTSAGCTDDFPWLAVKRTTGPKITQVERNWYTDDGRWSLAGECACDLVAVVQ